MITEPMLAAATHFLPHVLGIVPFNFTVHISQLKKMLAVDFAPPALQLSFEG